jgi:drug/metabolite transporter (DMT)-like permease
LSQVVSSTPPRSVFGGDLAAVAVCGLIWGTTWFAITLQLGPVPAIVSVVYRFALAAGLVLAWCALRRQKLWLTPRQHLAVFGQGVCTFAISYAWVYWAEAAVPSAIVAVLFAGLAFVNLVLFRIIYRTRAPWLAWVGAAFGVAGVALMSMTQLAAARMDARAVSGLLMALGGVAASALGNVFAQKGASLGAATAPATGWAMAYGAALLAVYALATGTRFSFDPRPAYVLSLVYLSVFGSVVAFLVYFGLAQRRGFTFASYVSALTPPLALAMSALLEHARFGLGALLGVALVLGGQILLIRAPR